MRQMIGKAEAALRQPPQQEQQPVQR